MGLIDIRGINDRDLFLFDFVPSSSCYALTTLSLGKFVVRVWVLSNSAVRFFFCVLALPRIIWAPGPPKLTICCDLETSMWSKEAKGIGYGAPGINFTVDFAMAPPELVIGIPIDLFDAFHVY